MKIPNKISAYCPSCNAHSLFTVKQYKKKSPSVLSQGQRKFLRLKKGYGSFPRPKPDNNLKNAKAVTLILHCPVCEKKRIRVQGKSRRVEIR